MYCTYLILLGISIAVQTSNGAIISAQNPSTKSAPSQSAPSQSDSTQGISTQNTLPSTSSTSFPKLQAISSAPSTTSTKSQISVPFSYDVPFSDNIGGAIIKRQGKGFRPNDGGAIEYKYTALPRILKWLQGITGDISTSSMFGEVIPDYNRRTALAKIYALKDKFKGIHTKVKFINDVKYTVEKKNKKFLKNISDAKDLIEEMDKLFKELGRSTKNKSDLKAAASFLRFLKMETWMTVVNDQIDLKSKEIACKEAEKAIANLTVSLEDPDKLDCFRDNEMLGLINEFIYDRSFELSKASPSFRKKSALLAKSLVANDEIEMLEDVLQLLKKEDDQTSIAPTFITDILVFQEKAGTKIIAEILKSKGNKSRERDLIVEKIRNILSDFRADADLSKPKSQAFRQNLNNLVFRCVATSYKKVIDEKDQDFMAAALIHVAYLYLGKVMQVDRTKELYIPSFDIKRCLEYMLDRVETSKPNATGALGEVISLLKSICGTVKGTKYVYLYSVYPSAKIDNGGSNLDPEVVKKSLASAGNDKVKANPVDKVGINFDTNIKKNLDLVTDVIKGTYNDAWYKSNSSRLPLIIPTAENIKAVIERFQASIVKHKSPNVGVIVKTSVPANAK